MGPCILILADHLSSTDWVVGRASASTTQFAVAKTALYSGRQLIERVTEAGQSASAADAVLLLEARMALGDVYSALDDLRSTGEPAASPVVVVSPDVEGADRIVRGYVYGMANKNEKDAPLKRFSKRVEAPAGV